MHDDQLPISLEVVRELIDDQFPAWRAEHLTELSSSGTVNALYRIGADRVARFPLRPGDPQVIRRQFEAEAAAATELLGRTRFRTPEPVAIGGPGPGYPLPWSVQTWLPGATASDSDVSASVAFAGDLAEFVRGVRAIKTLGRTFEGVNRGGDLRSHDGWMATCFERSEALLDVPRLRQVWARLRTLPRHDPDVMTHGDLIPGNLLVGNGRLTGIIDVGGLGAADPALDLVGAWHLLDDDARHAFRDELGVNEHQWERGKAWAFEQAMGTAWYYVTTNPPMSRMGLRTLDRILAGEPTG